MMLINRGNKVKTNYFLGIWLLIALLSCSSNTATTEKQDHPKTINCYWGSYFSYQDAKKYRAYSEQFYSLFVEPLKYDFFPIIDAYNNNGKKLQETAYKVEQLNAFEFINKTELKELITIAVDTTTYYFHPLGDSSLLEQYCFTARPVIFSNKSTDKYFLRDRFSRLKLILQAKNDNNEWMELHDIRAVGCGLENQISSSARLTVLPPTSYIHSCFIAEEGDFETTCRIQYKYYNRIDSSYFRTSKEDGYFRKFFRIEEVADAVYSNTFTQRVTKERLKKAKRIF